MVLHIQKYPQPFAIVNLSKPDTAAKVLFMTQVVGVASAEQCIAKYASYLKTSLESMGALYILMQARCQWGTCTWWCLLLKRFLLTFSSSLLKSLHRLRHACLCMR